MEKLKPVYKSYADEEGFVEHPIFYDIKIDDVRKINQDDYDFLYKKCKLLSMRNKIIEELCRFDSKRTESLFNYLDSLREASDRTTDTTGED